MDVEVLAEIVWFCLAGVMLSGFAVNALVAKRINQLDPNAYQADRPSMFDSEGRKILLRRIRELRRTGTDDIQLGQLIRAGRIIGVAAWILFLLIGVIGFGYQLGYVPRQLG
jgi:hypothetical protein